MHRRTVGIIGAGPAGVAAAIQLKRYGVDFIIFEQSKIGGLLRNANYIENYIGFPQGIGGKQLVGLIARHLKSLDVEVVCSGIDSVDYIDNYFLLKSEESHYQTDYLIVASGTKPIIDESIIIDDKAHEKVFFEIADINFEELNKAAIIGGGDAAFDYALNFSTKGIHSSIFLRRDKLNALPLLIHRAKEDERIKIFPQYKLQKIENGSELFLTFNHNFNEYVERTDCVIFAIGREPELSFLTKEFLAIKQTLIDDEKLVFAGDVKNKIYRQASISSGDGIFAAMKIFRKINHKNESN